MEYQAEHVRDRAKTMLQNRMECLWEHRNYFDSPESWPQIPASPNWRPSYFRLDSLPKAKRGKLSGQIFRVHDGSQIKFSTAFAGNTQASKYFEFMRGYVTKKGQIIATTRKRAKHPIVRRRDYTLRKICRSVADVRELCAEICREHDKYADDDANRINMYVEVKPYLDLCGRNNSGPSNWGSLITEMESDSFWHAFIPSGDVKHKSIDWMDQSVLEACVKYVRVKMSKDVNYWLDKAYDLKGDIIERGAGGAK